MGPARHSWAFGPLRPFWSFWSLSVVRYVLFFARVVFSSPIAGCIGVFSFLEPGTFVLGRFADSGCAGRALAWTVTFLFLVGMIIRQFVQLETAKGKSVLVDFGPKATPGKEELEEGNRIQVTGPRTKLNGKYVLVAQQVSAVNPEKKKK